MSTTPKTLPDPQVIEISRLVTEYMIQRVPHQKSVDDITGGRPLQELYRPQAIADIVVNCAPHALDFIGMAMDAVVDDYLLLPECDRTSDKILAGVIRRLKEGVGREEEEEQRPLIIL